MSENKVICDSVNEYCAKFCPHGTPHSPILDDYLGAMMETFCNEAEPSYCGFRADEPLCICVPAEQEGE